MATPPGPGLSDVTAPTCFRHPNRETYVSCVRCGRHACPDCLRSAAVGQQCVECIRDANRTSRQAAAPFGGRVATTPTVTYALIALNVLIYVAELAYGNTVTYGEMVGLGLGVNRLQVIGVAQGDWYRLLSSAFLHATPGSGIGIAHIAFNMWALYAIGPALERLLGHARFIAVYLVSALAGSVLLYLVAPFQPAIGASGAIFGLFGAWFVLARRLRLDARMIVGLIVINLVITFTFHNIAWQDHVGGLVAGAALTAAYVYAPKANRTLIQVGATAVVVGLLLAAVVLKDQLLVHQVLVRL
jgi:membrane associated rhomboid family serine protease